MPKSVSILSTFPDSPRLQNTNNLRKMISYATLAVATILQGSAVAQDPSLSSSKTSKPAVTISQKDQIRIRESIRVIDEYQQLVATIEEQKRSCDDLAFKRDNAFFQWKKSKEGSEEATHCETIYSALAAEVENLQKNMEGNELNRKEMSISTRFARQYLIQSGITELSPADQDPSRQILQRPAIDTNSLERTGKDARGLLQETLFEHVDPKPVPKDNLVA